MKQTMKNLSIAAFVAVGAIMLGCNKLEENTQPKQKENIVTMTTTIGLGESTKALTAAGVKTFAEGEQIAVIYKNTSDQTVKATSYALTAGDISGTGAQENKTATFTVVLENPEAGTISYVYPAAMANDDGTMASIAAQDGSLSSLSGNLDYSYWTGSWDGTSLPGGETLTNQLAICKFTIKDGSTDITGNVTGLYVENGSDVYRIVRTAAEGPIYVAMLPVITGDIVFAATDGSHYYEKTVSGKALAAGKMYPINLSMVQNSTVNLSKIVTDYTVQDGETLTGTLVGNHQIMIAADAKVTLSDATIHSTAYDAIKCLGSATVVLADGTTNTLTTAEVRHRNALHAGDYNTTLTIQGNTGKLTAKSYGLYSGGIGGGYNNTYPGSGNITIEGGIIEASGATGSAGIGADEWSRCNTITITGGNITATGGWGAAGIGGGSHDYYDTFANIIISGGIINATGGNGAAGIGNGYNQEDTGKNITITRGITSVTATKGGTEAGFENAVPIGAGHNSSIGNVTFGCYIAYNGSAWSPDPMVSGRYGGLDVVISGDTWTLTPYQGTFTVNGSGKKVIFSPGVLQYKATEATYKWRFAENQWDRTTNTSNDSWTNHFSWSTWTGDSPTPNKQSTTASEYSSHGDFIKESELANPIHRGYDWYTLSRDEWKYLFDHHTYGAAQVHGMNGVIVLPDGMTSATGFTPGMEGFKNVSNDNWAAMEADGALFLPVAGSRSGSSISNENYYGYYWSISGDNGYKAYGLYFYSYGYEVKETDDPQGYANRHLGKLVRLVHNVD